MSQYYMHIVYVCVCGPKLWFLDWSLFEHSCCNSSFVWHCCCWCWKCRRRGKPEMPCGSEQQQGLLQICTQCTMNEFMTRRSPWFFWMALRTFYHQNLSNGFSIFYFSWGQECGSHGSSAKNHFDFCKRVNIPIRGNSSVGMNQIPINHSLEQFWMQLAQIQTTNACTSCSDPKDAGMTGAEAEPIKTIEDNFITTFSSAWLQQSWWCDEASWDRIRWNLLGIACGNLNRIHGWGCRVVGRSSRLTKCSTKKIGRIYEGSKLTDWAIEQDCFFFAGW